MVKGALQWEYDVVDHRQTRNRLLSPEATTMRTGFVVTSCASSSTLSFHVALNSAVCLRMPNVAKVQTPADAQSPSPCSYPAR